MVGNGHNHTQNSVMFIITFKTILNDKVGCQFCQVTQLFWLLQKVVQNTKYEIINIFNRSSRDPRKKANDPQVENHRFK